MRLRLFLSILFRLIPIAGGISGFFLFRWLGTITWIGTVVGVIVGIIASITLWFLGATLSTINRHACNRRRMAPLSITRLREVASDPCHPDFGCAMMELDRRGIEVLPSLERVIDLLLSPDAAQRGVGMGLFMVVCPDIQPPKGSSNHDPPEVWRSRLRDLNLLK